MATVMVTHSLSHSLYGTTLKARGVATVMVLAKRGAGNPKPLAELQRCDAVDVCVFVKWYAQAFPQLVGPRL